MKNNWSPNGNIAYLDFSNLYEATTKYRNPTNRLLTESSSTLQLVGTLAFPRNYFMNGDEIEETPAIG